MALRSLFTYKKRIMEKEILKLVEDAYREGLRSGNSVKDIKVCLITSQIVANRLVNKFFKANVIKSVCDKCTDKNAQNIGNFYVCPFCDRTVN